MYIVFDIETTGFNKKVCDIIQFAYTQYDYENNLVESGNMFFYKKGMHWSEEAKIQSHGIELSFLEQFEDEYEANIYRMFALLNQNFVVGHNVKGFDIEFCELWCVRKGLGKPNIRAYRDTLDLFRQFMHSARFSLQKLYAALGYSDEAARCMLGVMYPELSKEEVDQLHAHDARYDVAMTNLCVLKAIQANYLSWGTETKQKIVTTDISTTQGRIVDPDGFNVRLLKADGSVESYFVNTNKDKYENGSIEVDEESLLEGVRAGKYFPIQMLQDAEIPTNYTAKNGNTSYLLVRMEKFDVFCITVGDNTYTKDQVNIAEHIKLLEDCL